MDNYLDLRSILQKGMLLLLAGMLLLPFAGRAEAAHSVDSTHAVVESQDRLPPLIQQRMQKSVQAISDQLLIGQQIDKLQDTSVKRSYEQVIYEVFDKILVGYSISAVKLVPGEDTGVEVNLVPWNDTIQDVQVQVEVEGLNSNIENLVRRELIGIDRVFSDSLKGLPVAATDWSNGVLKKSLNSFMEEKIPEFLADFDLETDVTTKVKVTVYPKLPAVRTVDLFMRSETVPNVVLQDSRKQAQYMADQLIGVPVGFLDRHQEDIKSFIASSLDNTSGYKTLGLATRVEMTVGENTKITTRSDTSKYLLRIQGWADIGNSKGSGKDSEKNRFRAIAGINLSQRDLLYGQLDLYPQHFHPEWAVGYSRKFNSKTSSFLRYDISYQRFAVGAEYWVAPRWLLRYEHRWSDRRGEVGIRYKLHDFLSLEYVLDTKDNWLRLIGTF